MLKTASFVILFALFANCDEKIEKYSPPEFYSIGMLPENSRFVCINGEKWLEEKEDDKIILQKLYFFNDETNKEEAHKCI